MRRSHIKWILLFLLLSSPFFDAFNQVTYIKAGKIVDPVTGTASKNQVIIIEGKKIKSINEGLKIPPNSSVIDLSQYTISPGLFDVHTHLCSSVSKFADWLGVDYFDMVLLNPNGYRAIQGSVNARHMLEAGFTTVRDAGNAGKFADVDVKRAINEGLIPGPTMVVAGKIIAPFGGQFRTRADKDFLINDEYTFADTRDELRKAIRENIYYGADVIKIVVDGQKYSYSYEDIKFIVDEAAAARVKVMAHCQTPSGEYAAARAGVASIEHAWTLPDSVAALMKKNDVVLVSTDFTENVLQGFGHPRERAQQIHQRRVDRLKRAYGAGVTIAFGTDVMIDLENETRGSLAIQYIISFTEAGIPPHDIIKMLTINPAKLMGMENQRGRLTPEMFADLIATPIDPLQDIAALQNVVFVMKDGVVVKNSVSSR
jgi:imidazolonepropionase-like amidohydrolase